MALSGTAALAQYRPETISTPDSLIGKRVWISPPLPMQGGEIVFEGAKEVPGLTKEILFGNALEWYNYNYKTADTRLEVEKAAEGLISGTGVIRYTPVAAGVAGEVPIFFRFNIQVADGKYSYKFYEMYGLEANGRFSYADMYREDRDTNPQLKPRWGKKYRYEMLYDMTVMVEMSIAHLQQAMLMNSGVVTR